MNTDLLITGVIDGPLPNGLPKAIEIFVRNDVLDLSIYGVGSANNGGGSDGEEFTFPNDSALSGDFIYLATETPIFSSFFGFAPNYTDGSTPNINGDDAIELFKDGSAVDVFGVVDVDGSGQPWEYLDGWAYRNGDTDTTDGATNFNIAQWTFSGPNALDGEVTNGNANSPFPLGDFVMSGGTVGPAPLPPPPPPLRPVKIHEIQGDGSETPISGELVEVEALVVGSSVGPAPLPPPPPPLRPVKIHEIQGDGSETPISGELVEVEALVVGSYQTFVDPEMEGLDGFFIQEEDGDADSNPATSEGIFVLDGSSPEVVVKMRDKVRVVGRPSEDFGQTILTADLVEVLSHKNKLPRESRIYLDPNGVEDPKFEQYEGMRVRIDQKLVLTEQFNLDRFADVRFAAGDRPFQYTQLNTPDKNGFEVNQERLANRVIVVDDGSDRSDVYPITTFDIYYTTETAPRMGDFTPGLRGVLRFAFGDYRIVRYPGERVVIKTGNPRPLQAPKVRGNFTISAYNVLNYFLTVDAGDNGSGPSGDDPRGADDSAEFYRQTTKLVTNLLELDADVLALSELENDFMLGGLSNALAFLTRALNEHLGEDVYAYLDPQTSFVDVSDVISVGIIYKPCVVEPIGVPAILTDDVVMELDFDASLPIFDDPNTNRAPLAASFAINKNSGGQRSRCKRHYDKRRDRCPRGLVEGFESTKLFPGNEEQGDQEQTKSTRQMYRNQHGRKLSRRENLECFTLVVNHFKSKGGCSSAMGIMEDQGDGAGCYNPRRLSASEAIFEWLKTDPTKAGCPNVVISGDLNAYAKEDPVTFWTDEKGYTNVESPSDYSYVFDGQIGTLDYLLVNPSMAKFLVDAQVWHINEDEADAIDYNLPNGRPLELFDGKNPARASDHSPVVAGFNHGMVK